MKKQAEVGIYNKYTRAVSPLEHLEHLEHLPLHETDQSRVT